MSSASGLMKNDSWCQHDVVRFKCWKHFLLVGYNKSQKKNFCKRLQISKMRKAPASIKLNLFRSNKDISCFLGRPHAIVGDNLSQTWPTIECKMSFLLQQFITKHLPCLFILAEISIFSVAKANVSVHLQATHTHTHNQIYFH